MNKKSYGLIIPKQEKLRQQELLLQRKPIFDQDDLEDDDDDGGLQLPVRSGPSLIPMTSKANNLVKKEIQKAMAEDSSVFEYDEVYDDMKSGASGSSHSEKVLQKKPKYMDNLLKSAELRKREKEQREEKKIQKERDAEGDEFADKEIFMTSAYKEQQKVIRETEARLRNEADCEARLDVKKQQDLSGFYRHLLNQETGTEKIATHSSSDRFNAPSATSSADNEKKDDSGFKKSAVPSQKNLRKRNDSESDDDHVREEGTQSVNNAASVTRKSDNDTQSTRGRVKEAAIDKNKSYDLPPKADKAQEVTEKSEEPDTPLPELEPAIDRRTLVLQVFQKRTVGDVFEEAVRRFHERQKERGS